MIEEIRKELKENVDQKYKEGSINYFKEKIKVYGVRGPMVDKISQKYFNKELSKEKIFSLCEDFLKPGYNEEAKIAFDWAFRLKKQFKKSDFKVFENWLKKYIDNWGKCDDFCTHAFGYLISQYPEYIKEIKKWAKSKNRWERRASAVIFISSGWRYYVNEKYFKDVFEIAEILLKDEDDLVQKGYGWMLKAASVTNQKAVFDFVMKHKKEMPRTALRYAIEKMPQKMKVEAMRK